MSTSTELIPLSEVREALLSGRRLDPIDPDQVAEAIAERLLQAESLDDVMNPEARQAEKAILGVPFTLRSLMFMPSDVEDAKVPVFCVLDAVVNGEGRIFTCGGRGVVIQCLRLVEAGALPRRVKLIEVGQEKPGRSRPLYLQDVKGAEDSEAPF